MVSKIEKKNNDDDGKQSDDKSSKIIIMMMVSKMMTTQVKKSCEYQTSLAFEGLKVVQLLNGLLLDL